MSAMLESRNVIQRYTWNALWNNSMEKVATQVEQSKPLRSRFRKLPIVTHFEDHINKRVVEYRRRIFGFSEKSADDCT